MRIDIYMRFHNSLKSKMRLHQRFLYDKSVTALLLESDVFRVRV